MTIPARGRIALLAAALTLWGCAPQASLIEDPIVAKLRQGMREGDSGFDHSGLDALLREHVRAETGRVDYAGLKRDSARLDAYLATLATAPVETMGRPQQQALLINAYNAYTLKIIIERYPALDSIRDLDDPWKTRRHQVARSTLSLDDIEHGLLRPLYREPRVHFAVNCASIGCPPLRAGAYQGARLEQQLDEAAQATLQSERYARMEDGVLKLTAILDWYGDDFINRIYRGYAPTLPEYVARYTTPPIRREIKLADDDLTVRFLPYDWRLNDIER